MKKIISLILTFFFCITNNCYAFSALYYVKGINTIDMLPIIENSYTSNNFKLTKKNPYYGISEINQDSAVIIVQQSGENLFYYYQTENNTKINKQILKEIKRLGKIYEQSFNSSLIEIYDTLADDIKSQTGSKKVYTFEEPENSVFEPPIHEQNYTSSTVYKGYVSQLNAGTKIEAYLQNAINTATAAKGDRVIAVLTNSIKYNGLEVAPQGSLVYGYLSKARPATYGSRNGRVVIIFNQLVTPDNKVYDISTEEIDFTVSNEGKIGESVKNAAAKAAAGAVVGLLFGLLSGGDHVGRSVAIGAGVGAGSSIIYSSAERGVDAEIPSFTEMELTLTQPLNITVGY